MLTKIHKGSEMNDLIKLKAGDRIKHPTRSDWGIGEVLFDEENGQVEVLFEDVSKIKKFNVGVAKFVVVVGAEAASEYLSALVRSFHERSANPKAHSKKSVSTSSFQKAVETFISYFPHGFNDPKYLTGKTGEREYKIAAVQLMSELLNQLVFSELIAEERFQEICARAKSVINKTNLIHTYEKIWLTNALATEKNQILFAHGLYDLLYAEGPVERRFEQFSKMLYAINAAKWPIATYFLFIGFPDSQIFVKPQVTQNAADVLSMSINYRPELNWLTYSQVLNLAQGIKTKLDKTGNPDLKAKDMVDIQSFIWVIAPSYY